MRTTVYVRVVSSRNDYGEPVYATAQTLKGRVDSKRRQVKTERGENAISEMMVMLPTSTTTGDGMQISLNGTTYQDVIVLASPRGLSGAISHYEAYV
jgi:hypothetical protein